MEGQVNSGKGQVWLQTGAMVAWSVQEVGGRVWDSRDNSGVGLEFLCCGRNGAALSAHSVMAAHPLGGVQVGVRDCW